ncbi:Protein kinase-like domain [Phytophthora cactorum]|nr:Protein kinase-like domain [Phytophthora cactorum]
MNARYGDTSRSSVCDSVLASEPNHAPRPQTGEYFLTLKGVVKVGDLGLGRYLSENTMEARSKVGTAVYVAGGARGESYYEEIPEVYSEHLRGIVKQMISLTASNRPSVQEVWEFCRTRPSSAVLQERVRKHQAASQNKNNGTRKDPETHSITSLLVRQQQETPPQSRPHTQGRNSTTITTPITQGDASNTATEESVKRRHAEARMELLFERLKILSTKKSSRNEYLPPFRLRYSNAPQSNTPVPF